MELNVKTIATFEGLFKQAGRIEKSVVSGAEGTEQASFSSIFKKTAGKTNPFFMDAKANLAKLDTNASLKSKFSEAPEKKLSSLLDIKPKNEYELLEESALNETSSAVKKEIIEVYSKINPVTSDNISAIKTELSSLIENPEIREKLLNCTNPNEFYAIVKENMNKILSSSQVSKFFRETRLSFVTPRLEAEGQQIFARNARMARQILNVFSPKSTIPEVIKIEEEVKALGVKDVNFSNDLEQARLTKEAVEDLKKKQIPLPDSINVTSAMPSGCYGIGIHSNAGGDLFLGTSLEKPFAEGTNSRRNILVKNTDTYRNASAENQKKLLDRIIAKVKSVYSTANPKHVIWHELAHTFQPYSIKSYTRKLTKDELETAGEISQYAKSNTNGQEAMPEMFAKLMDGQTLTDKQMELYLKLGGIVPKS